MMDNCPHCIMLKEHPETLNEPPKYCRGCYQRERTKTEKQDERIKELEAGQLDFAKETTRIHKTKIQRIKELERLLSTVQVQYDYYHSIQQQTLKEVEQALKGK